MMRLRALLGLAVLTGVLAMIATADEPKKDEKKDKPPDLTKVESFTDKVTVRQWNRNKFLNPAKDVPALHRMLEGRDVFLTFMPIGTAKSPKDSEIIAADGTVWIVEKVREGVYYHTNYVKAKPKDK